MLEWTEIYNPVQYLVQVRLRSHKNILKVLITDERNGEKSATSLEHHLENQFKLDIGPSKN